MIVASEVTMTSRRTAWVGVVLFLVVAMGALAMAHHSFAVFDHNTDADDPRDGDEVSVDQSARVSRSGHSAGGRDDQALQHRADQHQHDAKCRMAIEHDQGRRQGDRSIVAPLLSGEPVGLGLEVTMADGSTKALPVPNIGSFKRTPEAQ